MNLKPLKDQILVEEIQKEEIRESGIIIPDTAEKEGPVQGRVVAIGDGVINQKGERIPLSIKVGDNILFKKGYGVDQIKFDGNEYLIMKEDDVIGIIK